jgi:hypothetical protein
MRRWLLAIAFLGLTATLALSQTPGVTVNKQPENLSRRTFDPMKPPSDMPPVQPPELAECDSEFLAVASVGAQAKQTGPTQAMATITQIDVKLNLNIVVWLPTNTTQHITDHEEGHHQISQAFYQNADKVAARIAQQYVGKQFPLSGTDLRGALSKALQTYDDEISNEYLKEITPEPTQLRYDAINDHGRNDVAVNVAMAQALQQIPPK